MNPISRRLINTFVLSLSFVLITSVSAKNKVVIIPLSERVQAPKIYATLPAVEPPTSAYIISKDYVTDKQTGLRWQRTDDNIKRNWNDARAYCRDLILGGQTDWRLPSAIELMSIVDYSKCETAINADAFPDTDWWNYWSSTYFINGGAWIVYAMQGGVFNNPESDTNYVRCVRWFWLPARDIIFQDNGNGTATDLATGLTWQREDDNTGRSWADASLYCEELSLGGKQDWRLPTIKELWSIVDVRVRFPAIDANVFPNTKYGGYSFYCTSTPNKCNHNYPWIVDFSEGVARSNDHGTYFYYARCVRSEK